MYEQHKKPLAQLHISAFGHLTEVSPCIIQMGGCYEHFVHTFEFVNLFPIKMYQNYFREEIDANQCNQTITISLILLIQQYQD